MNEWDGELKQKMGLGGNLFKKSIFNFFLERNSH